MKYCMYDEQKYCPEVIVLIQGARTVFLGIMYEGGGLVSRLASAGLGNVGRDYSRHTFTWLGWCKYPSSH